MAGRFNDLRRYSEACAIKEQINALVLKSGIAEADVLDLLDLMHSAPMSVPGYDKLAGVFRMAYDQAASGKGKERHAAGDTPFHEQPMATINRQLGSIDGFIYQAHKKSLEAKRLPDERAIAELLGAINYLAGAVIALQTWAARDTQSVDPA